MASTGVPAGQRCQAWAGGPDHGGGAGCRAAQRAAPRAGRGRAGPHPWEGLAAVSKPAGFGGFPESSVTCRRAGVSQPLSTHAATPCILLPASWVGSTWCSPSPTPPTQAGGCHNPRARRSPALSAILVFWDTSCAWRCLRHVQEVSSVGNSFTNDAAPGS